MAIRNLHNPHFNCIEFDVIKSASDSNICCVLAYKSVGGGKQPNAINNRANRAYFTYKAPTMFAHQAA